MSTKVDGLAKWHKFVSEQDAAMVQQLASAASPES